MNAARKTSNQEGLVTPRDLVKLASDPDAVIAKVLLSLAQQSEPNTESSLEDIVKAVFNTPRSEPVEDRPVPQVPKEPRLMYRVSEVSESLGIFRTVIYQLIQSGSA